MEAVVNTVTQTSLLARFSSTSALLLLLLFAVGQDCYTRLWSLRDGHLLRTIPSPHPAGKDSIPNVVFSSQLGGRRGLPGLLMAVCHDLYYYPYGDYQDGTTSGAQA